jgi:hypothetical protein
MSAKRVIALFALVVSAGSCEQPTNPFFLSRNPINGVEVYLPLLHVMQVGDTIRIDAEGFHDGYGVGTEYPHSVSFTATDTTVLRLEPVTWTLPFVPSMRARGLKPGLVTLSATINGVTGSDTLRVIPEVASITLSPSATTFFVGDTIPVAVEIRSTGGDLITERVPLVFPMTDGIVLLAGSYGNNRVVGRNPGTTVLVAFLGPDTGRVMVTVQARP